ncbi:hypothetical protein DFP72DRAFT_972051 [Ephemerocybe angulata]|uniref:Cep57 centrosome microtubule-binding domain-containing protein n=1 Tax=Ephemerocybe angulata TaxID=980116 RepID=A0A8H6LYU9_9AGAR|nr:hypothetical protein DFP72DRAFT_972051 [Tulosesus angulatus]
MKRHAKGPAPNVYIARDELEQGRRQLENRLKSTASIPAPPLASDDEDVYHYHSQNSSVEMGRHGSEPMGYPDFPSFAHRSREHFAEEDSHMQMGWSYRTGDDDDGVSPYGGETMSTAAHHASAVTLTAGLGGGRGARRDVSMSGAEYDPDRPLNQIMAGVGRMSMFDDPSKSKHTATNNNITFEPLVVDSTAELDRILQSGFAQQNQNQSHNQSIHPTPPLSRASSSSLSDSDPGSPSRPKLSDHLRTLAFSPKRPRTAAPIQPASPAYAQQASPLAKRSSNHGQAGGGGVPLSTNTTPRPTRRVAQPPTPEVRLQPPTPSTASSKFTRMARGIVRDIADSRADDKLSSRRSSLDKQESVPIPAARPNVRKGIMKEQQSKSRIHLPDVTGLTAAVESPARLGKEFHAYKGANSREAEARFIQTLSKVQSKIQQLNDENGISRRRVRELEMELDDAKRDVARERTRLLEKEDVIIQQQKEMAGIASRSSKGKGRARDNEAEEEEDVLKRYRDAVDEKKALESLINTLRSHLTRLTQELSDHSHLLQELKEMRDTDHRVLREKSADISRLNDEVERLAGEVEVLRGVVEEGLRERRAGKEPTAYVEEEADTSMSLDRDDEEEEEDEGEREREEREEEEEEEEAQETPDEQGSVEYRPHRPPLFNTDSEEDAEDETYEPSFSFRASTPPPAAADRTVRTDHATLGTSGSANTPHRVTFIDQRELRRIEREVEERRGDLSVNGGGGRGRGGDGRGSGRGSPELEATSFYERPRTPTPPSPSPSPRAGRMGLGREREAANAGAGVGGRARESGKEREKVGTRRQASPRGRDVEETPFPQIRGDRLERLFFAAPEHNPRTCTVCFRRRGTGAAHGHDDEEEEEEGDRERAEERRTRRGSGEVTEREIEEVPNDPSYFRRVGSRAGLPPQTVAMRVIRELEDDFTHYKSVYCELADQYKEMDPVSDVPRRNYLAKHLREVVDILEQKGDQIASLSDLLAFKDKGKAPAS